MVTQILNSKKISELNEWITRADALMTSARDEANRLKNSLNLGHQDVRGASFSRIALSLKGLRIALRHLRQEMDDASWWIQVMSYDLSDPEFKDKITDVAEGESEDFLCFVRFGFFTGVFVTVESTLRLIVQALQPSVSALNTIDPRGHYSKVYKPLAKELKLPNIGSGSAAISAEDFLDFWSACRNTIHNNGVFRPQPPGDKTFKYRGDNSIEYKDNRLIEVGVSRMLDLSEDAIQLLKCVVASPEVQAITEIKDPRVL